MKLDLNAPEYKKLPNEKSIGNADLTRFILQSVMGVKYPQGIPRTESKMWAKVLDQFADKVDVIELDGTMFDFVNDVVQAQDLVPALVSYLWCVRDYFESMKKDGEKKPAGKLESVAK